MLGLRNLLAIVVTAVLAVSGMAQKPQTPAVTTDRWEKDIAAFESMDEKNPPAPGGIVFVGSSSIRKWKLQESFPELMPINRGFGGSEMSDSVRYADRIVIPYRPRQIVVYAGDNDISHKKSADVVTQDFQQFVNTVFESLPNTKIAFIAIKPSLKRWALWPTMRHANEAIRSVCEKDSRLDFIDISLDTLGEDGLPKKAFFVADGLHLSDDGYQAWTARVRNTLGW